MQDNLFAFNREIDKLVGFEESERILIFILVLLLGYITGRIFKYILDSISEHDFRVESYYSDFLPFMCIALSCLFFVLQSSVMLSIGLLGALSIIRFRSVVSDIRETIIILCIVTSALLNGTTHFKYLAMLILALCIIFYFLKKKNFIRHIQKTQANISASSGDITLLISF
jgi:lysylphosphatidylglycerol synthetase-like protein (DUF2156 family)